MTHRQPCHVAVAISCARTVERPESRCTTGLVSYGVQGFGQGLCIFFTFVFAVFPITSFYGTNFLLK